MRLVNMVTAKSGFNYLGSENGRKAQKLGDLQRLCIPNRGSHGQGWTFKGDFKRKVAPIFFAK